jgi:hypothetical protein
MPCRVMLPGRQIACDLDADNPGQWMTHCHNLYHAPESTHRDAARRGPEWRRGR